MSALVIGLLILAFIGFGYLMHRGCEERVEEARAEKDEALDIARAALRLHGEALELFADEQHAHEQTRDDLRWSRITAATLIAPDMRPTILAAHRDLAPVVPIGGRG